MHWKGYIGCVGGYGGALGWEGAIRLQWLQWVRSAVMAEVMPGQKTVDSARASIEVTPWCAECNTVSMCWRSEGGIMIRSLYIAMPSTVFRWSEN